MATGIKIQQRRRHMTDSTIAAIPSDTSMYTGAERPRTSESNVSTIL